MKKIHILWQRLVTSEGKTCDRCHGTQEAIERLIPKLHEVLLPLGMEPVLETREIDRDVFKDNPSESNRIWIEGKPIEEWLNAGVGNSACCSACGGSECRTLEVEGAIFETIPEQLILKAALLAASHSAGLSSDTKG